MRLVKCKPKTDAPARIAMAEAQMTRPVSAALIYARALDRYVAVRAPQVLQMAWWTLCRMLAHTPALALVPQCAGPHTAEQTVKSAVASAQRHARLKVPADRPARLTRLCREWHAMQVEVAAKGAITKAEANVDVALRCTRVASSRRFASQCFMQHVLWQAP